MSVAIIGAGLSGLALARALQNSGIDYTIYEARGRAGGRVLSTSGFDLGPTWFWPDDNPLMLQLLNQLQLQHFPQFTRGHSLYQTSCNEPPQRFVDPQGYRGAHRINGGTTSLINALCGQLKKPILFNQPVAAISKHADGVLISFQHGSQLSQTLAQQVVLCLPPRLIAHTIEFTPVLNEPFIGLLKDTPTWMGWQAKAIITFDSCFWREQGLNGSVFCGDPTSLIGEMFDACDAELNTPALGIFLTSFAQQMLCEGFNAGTENTSLDSVKEAIKNQLQDFFGEIAKPKEIFIHSWSHERFTSTHTDLAPLQMHPHYGHPWLELDHWEDRLFFCGSESAGRAGGYMEGALVAARRVATSVR